MDGFLFAEVGSRFYYLKENEMKRVSLILCGVFLFSCTVQNEKNLNGVWKYLSGNYTFNDTSFTVSKDNNFKSIKIYGDTHYSLITQNQVKDMFLAHSGLYRLEGDEYTEMFKMHKDTNMIGQSATFKYQINSNQLFISSQSMDEVWEKVE